MTCLLLMFAFEKDNIRIYFFIHRTYGNAVNECRSTLDLMMFTTQSKDNEDFKWLYVSVGDLLYKKLLSRKSIRKGWFFAFKIKIIKKNWQ